MILGMAGLAPADPEHKCRDSMLNGLYVFTASGFGNVSPGPPQPQAIVELVRFSGDETARPGVSLSVNGASPEERGFMKAFNSGLGKRAIAISPAKGARSMGKPSVQPRCKTTGILGLTLVIGAVALLFLATPVLAETDVRYQATFVEIGGVVPGVQSCGSATISQLGHVAFQCVLFDKCGPNCEERTITFSDGSALVIHESIVGVISPGNSVAAAEHAPQFLQITQTIVGGTGRFQGATGSGTGIVNLAANAVIIASGTITLP